MTQQKKARPVGRPKLPKGAAKGKIVPVRFTADEMKAIKAMAKNAKQSVSQWVRSVIEPRVGLEIGMYKLKQLEPLSEKAEKAITSSR